MANIKTATAITPVTLQGQLSTAETTFYTAAVGKALKVSTATLTNTTASPVTVSLSIVKSGGSAGGANRIRSGLSLAANTSIDVQLGVLNEGDFISAIAGTAAAVTFAITGFEFSSDSVAAATGIRLVAYGARGYGSNVNSINTTINVTTDLNRYLIVPLFLSNNAAEWAKWENYTAFTVTSDKSGALTRLASANCDVGGQETGSVHFFGVANPATGLHTITTNVTKTGTNKFIQNMKPMLYAGVSGVNGAASNTSGGSSNLTALAVVSAAGNVPLFAGIGFSPYEAIDQIVRDMDSRAKNNVVLEAAGAASVTFNTGPSMKHGEVGINLVAA
ncbi:hypothetical protein [Mycolicibacterium mucogenicum]|uniref:Uncharacterized protein n=1 Tax=Mycolicibacterium mucogenicum DSM 44124 TaxID=1226753 RepID=A0A8H2JG87_MYCMU|nr:hypothetical protein [Mycolicibacterium mucogenicum]KAB7752871.1 hypothetical protein MMUC44124_26410 [Mycolicibacterium mucogenicum DSM 44124]QPG69076.1 hypothetical protein C1S78_027435 [Mycolicibacterium mucogenicum DSM 44124]